MKILLINPPRYNEVIGNNPSIIEEERGFNPPLGLLYVAAYIEKYTEYEIAVIDAQVEQLDYSQLRQRIETVGADVVGITAMTLTIIDVLKTAEIVKKVNADTKVVLGGPHVNLFPKETIAKKNVDYLVLGEGEVVFKELMDGLNSGRNLSNITGIVYKEKGEIIIKGWRPHIEDLDRLPFPARHLVPYRKYSSLLSSGRIVTTMITSRGCPYQCTFCDRPSLGKKFRARTADNVVDELQTCYDMGIRHFLFYDDTFTVDKKRVLEICRKIIKRNLRISWDIRTRVDTIDEEMLERLKKAGCKGIHYGVEAGTKKILKILRKGISIPHLKTIFAITRRHKIEILAYFMIGNPTETKEDIEQTFRMMRTLDPDYVHLTILTPFPGTKIYSDGMEQGIIAKDVWREFAENPTADFVPPHWNEYFSKEELEKYLRKGYKSFYLRLRYILRRLMRLRSIGELKRKAIAGFKVIVMR